MHSGVIKPAKDKPRGGHQKGDIAKKTLQERAKIIELCRAGKTMRAIQDILGLSQTSTYRHIKKLVQSGELAEHEVPYHKTEEGKWYKVIERTAQELPFYERQQIVPTARKMYYRLIELGVLTKSVSNYNNFTTKSAEARKGVDSTYAKPTNLPRLPIDCFRDENRQTIGETDMSEPSDPSPNEPPQDPIEATQYAIQDCKDIILDYDGRCYEGKIGINPGRWYKQPVYCQILCESETIQPDLKKFVDEGKRSVRVGSTRGFPSTPYMYTFCKELRETVEKYDWIEKIVILYFGDSDKSGNEIRRNVEASLDWYSGGGSDEFEIPVPVELRLVAITPEQVKKFKLTGYQLEAFMTTENRLRDFRNIVLSAIDDCWDENTYNENCPPKEFDYEENDMEEPEDIDVDNEQYEDTNMTIREKMIDMAAEAFKPGWERNY